MSLINEMLRDLESKKKDDPLKVMAFQAVGKKNTTKALLSPFNIVFCFVLFNLVVGLSVLFFKKIDRPFHLQRDEQLSDIASPQTKSKPVVLVAHSLVKEDVADKPSSKSYLPAIVIAEFIPKVASLSYNNTEVTVVTKRYKPETRRQKTLRHYQRALELIEQEKIELATTKLMSLIDADPTFIKAYPCLAGLYLQQGQLDRVEALVLKAQQHFPHAVVVTQLRAQLLIEQGQYQTAVKLLKKTSPSIQHYPDYYTLLAIAYEKIGEFFQAGEIYRELVSIAPEKGAYWLGLGIAYEATQRLNQAVSAYQQAIHSFDITPMLAAYAKERVVALQG